MSATAQILEALAEVKRDQQAMRDEFTTLKAQRVHGGVPAAPPFGRKGENIMGSRGFSFAKLIAGIGSDSRQQLEKSKIEMEFADRFAREMEKSGWRSDRKNSYLAPLWPEGFDTDSVPEGLFQEMKSLIFAGTANADPGEVAWLEQKFFQGKSASTPASPAQSWIDQTIGGSFVPPASFGPPIELLRNREALMSAGATVMPLGPSGRLTMPRLTGATQGGWAGEAGGSNPVGNTPTQAKTGSLELSAKKVIAIVALPNELLRFASPAAEVLIRNDLFKTVALVADKGLLEGPGSSNQPLGLLTMGTTGVTGAGSNGSGVNGVSVYGATNITPTTANQLSPQDVYEFMAAIEENNGDMTAWIMRPQMSYAFYQSRWTPFSGGTSQGGFVFEITRGLDGKPQASIAGVPVTKTVQVSNKRGSGSQTYVLGLNAEDYIFGLFGAIEFTQTDAGYTLLASDQTAVRAVLTCDGGMRHPGLLAVADALNFVVGP